MLYMIISHLFTKVNNYFFTAGCSCNFISTLGSDVRKGHCVHPDTLGVVLADESGLGSALLCHEYDQVAKPRHQAARSSLPGR